MNVRDNHLTEEALFSYLHELSSGEEQAQSYAHLSGCSQCRQALEREKKLEVLLTIPASASRVKAPADLAFRVLEEVAPTAAARAMQVEQLSPQSWYWLIVSVALAITLLLMPAGVSSSDGVVSRYLSEAMAALRSESARSFMTVLIVAYVLWAFDVIFRRWLRTPIR